MEKNNLNFLYHTICQIWHYRTNLKSVLRDTNQHCATVLRCDPEIWFKQGVRILVLDFDGVLAAHGESCVNTDIQQWLESCINCFGENHVFLLSNRQDWSRTSYFEEKFPGICVFSVKKKKPAPDSLIEIAQQTNCSVQHLLMVDDRLMTGILSAVIAGTQYCWVRQPFYNLKKRFFTEIFFWGLRVLERLIVRYFF